MKKLKYPFGNFGWPLFLPQVKQELPRSTTALTGPRPKPRSPSRQAESVKPKTDLKLESTFWPDVFILYVLNYYFDYNIEPLECLNLVQNSLKLFFHMFRLALAKIFVKLFVKVFLGIRSFGCINFSFVLLL